MNVRTKNSGCSKITNYRRAPLSVASHDDFVWRLIKRSLNSGWVRPMIVGLFGLHRNDFLRHTTVSFEIVNIPFQWITIHVFRFICFFASAFEDFLLDIMQPVDAINRNGSWLWWLREKVIVLDGDETWIIFVKAAYDVEEFCPRMVCKFANDQLDLNITWVSKNVCLTNNRYLILVWLFF